MGSRALLGRKRVRPTDQRKQKEYTEEDAHGRQGLEGRSAQEGSAGLLSILQERCLRLQAELWEGADAEFQPRLEEVRSRIQALEGRG